LPARVAGRYAREGVIRLVAEDAPRYEDEVCLVFRADAQKSKASRAIGLAVEKAMTVI
jgi:hypothetical protein